VFAQTAFGIIFSAHRQFAELAAASVDLDQAASVSIEWGEVPAALAEPVSRSDWWQIAAGEYLLHVPAVGGFHVTASRVTVQPEAGSEDAAVRLYLFGSVMGALLHMRGVLPLHGSAVYLPRLRHAAVFTGASGVGKSTLAAALSRRGYPLMADDISAIGPSGGGALLHAGLTRSKLWRTSVDFLRFDPAKGDIVRPEKYAFDAEIFPRPAAVGHVYELSVHDGGDIALTKVEGVEKVRLLDRQTFRRNYVAGLNQSGQHLQRLVRLAGQIQVGRIARPGGEALSVDAVMDRLERDWDSVPAPAEPTSPP
jgi:hypothetical protein